MGEDAAERARERVNTVYRADSRRVLATLIRLLGDSDLAEEALHEAFTAAVEQWPRDSPPANPRAWSRGPAASRPSTACAAGSGSTRRWLLAERLDVETNDGAGRDDESVEDDRLRLIFTCCHPAL